MSMNLNLLVICSLTMPGTCINTLIWKYKFVPISKQFIYLLELQISNLKDNYIHMVNNNSMCIFMIDIQNIVMVREHRIKYFQREIPLDSLFGQPSLLEKFQSS